MPMNRALVYCVKDDLTLFLNTNNDQNVLKKLQQYNNGCIFYDHHGKDIKCDQAKVR